MSESESHNPEKSREKHMGMWVLHVPIRSVANRFKKAVSRCIRGHNRSDDSMAGLAFYHERDSFTNEETTPADDEQVDFPCFWAVEFYTPSHVDELVRHLQQLGWDRDDLPGRESPASWVRITRKLSQSGGWLSLGTIRSANDKRKWPPRDRTASLPMGVRYARGGIYSLTPSLTCVVVCFVFEETFRCRLDDILRKHRRTFARRLQSGREIVDPERQKTEETRMVRLDCGSLAARWFRENLPGVFSSSTAGKQFPTHELITLRVTEPFPDFALEAPPPSYLRILDMKFSPAVWKTTGEPGLKLSLGLMGDSPVHHSVFALRDSGESNNRLLEPYGDWVAYVDETFREMIGKLAIEPLLDHYSSVLNLARDSTTTGLRRSYNRRPLTTLKGLVGSAAYDIDIATVTADLAESTKDSSRFWRELERFVPCHDWLPADSLAEHLNQATNRYARQLNRMDSALRDHLTQFGSLVAATENVRTQNRILWLTIIVIALTIVTFVSSEAGSTLLGWLQDVWRCLGS